MPRTTKPPGPSDPGAFVFGRPGRDGSRGRGPAIGDDYFPPSAFFAAAAAFSRAVHGGVIALLRA